MDYMVMKVLDVKHLLLCAKKAHKLLIMLHHRTKTSSFLRIAEPVTANLAQSL